MNGTPIEREAYDELQGYTLTLGDATFVHQHVVDAWALQHANEASKPIAVLFALVGLYLYVERGFSGREVQRVHMLLAKKKESWPIVRLPLQRGAITTIDVMERSAGLERERAIEEWCASVWSAYRDYRPLVEELMKRRGIVG